MGAPCCQGEIRKVREVLGVGMNGLWTPGQPSTLTLLPSPGAGAGAGMASAFHGSSSWTVRGKDARRARSSPKIKGG